MKYLSPANRIREKRTYSIQLEERLENRMQTILRDRRHTLALYIERMKRSLAVREVEQWFLVCGSYGWEKYPFRDAGA